MLVEVAEIDTRDRGSGARNWNWARSLSDPERRWLPVLFLVALALRLLVSVPSAQIPTLNDMGVYDQLAMGLQTGEGYVSRLEPHFRSWRAPGYPYFLSAVFQVFGHSALAVAVLQSLLGAWSCVFVARIARHCIGPKEGIVAGSICVVDPGMLRFTGAFLTETLFIWLLALLVLLCVRLPDRRQLTFAARVGLVLGCAILVRPSSLLLVPFLMLHLAIRLPAVTRTRLCVAVGVPLFAALVVLPWTLRNFQVHGEFVPVASIGGVALFVGLPPSAIAPKLAYQREMADWKFLESGQHMLPNGYNLLPELFGRPAQQRLSPNFDELEQSLMGRQIFMRFVRDHPAQFLRLVAAKASLLFNPLPTHGGGYRLGDWNVMARTVHATFLFVSFGLIGAGMLFAMRRSRAMALLYTVFFYHVVFQLIFRPSLRYFLPGLVLAAPFGALALLGLPRWFAQAREGETRARLELALSTGLFLVLGANAYYQVVVLRGFGLAENGRRIADLFLGR